MPALICRDACGRNQGDVYGRIGDGDAVGIADDMNDNENWTGGFYELCLVLGAADDDNVDRALRSLWRAAGVQGCHVRRADGSGFAVVELGVAALHAHGHLRGALTLPSGARVVCGGSCPGTKAWTPWSCTYRWARWPESTAASAATPRRIQRRGIVDVA
ncbi:hypothetical protein [Verrucosispora sp. WMMD573]|uniref:hypothetical protein n=1 Tax=Verrucosispora sp. WMMD573 TaxID=3015149 RepID=UPI00248CEC6E|nr:hypothetical protein [Verrucosispora sp. WMMD573]WBB57206.1 hypothetical protein O7601_14705 [Verrucosispora sp. WMMD573]